MYEKSRHYSYMYIPNLKIYSSYLVHAPANQINMPITWAEGGVVSARAKVKGQFQKHSFSISVHELKTVY